MEPSGPRGDSWPPEVEGALIAHRRVLELLLATLAAARKDGGSLVDDLERRLSFQDFHEDPGVEPDPAYAIERASDQELRRLLRSVRDMVAAASR
jgi:uncharacterized membrane protein YebE (DUF533 family)